MTKTPKQEAEQLLANFYNIPNVVYSSIKDTIRQEVARQNAMKAVKLVIENILPEEIAQKSFYTDVLKELQSKPELHQPDHKDIALTMMQLLANATGAEFEDETLALDIMVETLKKSSCVEPSEDEQLEKLTEHNAKVVSDFIEHINDLTGIKIPDNVFESFFNA